MAGGGAQIFISHSSTDRTATDKVVALLHSRGFDSVFVNFDPVDGIPPGRNWERELYLALRGSDAVVAIDSVGWRASQWCFAEIALARSLGKAVMVLRTGDEQSATGTAKLTSDAQHISITSITETLLEPLFLELRRLEIGALRAFRWRPDRPPYAGLVTLDEQDAGVFFGRREETRSIIDLMERALKYGEIRMVLLVGPSGCGKSSLMRAGVVPQLRQRTDWRILGPGRVAEVARKFEESRSAAVTMVAMDQIDEALAASEGADLERVLQEIGGNAGRCLIVGALRTESLTAFDDCVAEMLPHVEKVLIGPVTRAGFREIITKPAEATGGSVEPALVDALLADLGSSKDVLPVLAVTLRQLWEHRAETQELTFASYERIGRLEGAIARVAESVMAASRLSPDDLDSLRRAFIGMVRSDREGRFGRRSLSMSSLTARQRKVLDRFVDEGLLVTGSTPGAIELAHEALIRTWPLLASWVENARQDLLRLERFEAALARWRDNSSEILQGIALVEAEESAKGGHPVFSNADATELLRASRAARDEALARERERERVIQVSESLRLASEAREASSAEPETAFLVGWEAVLWDRNEVTERVFRETLTRLPVPVSILRRPTRSSYLLAGFAGDFAFAADRDNGQVNVWSPDGQAAGKFTVPGGGPMAIVGLTTAEVLTYRDGTTRVHDCSGTIRAELQLSAASEERWSSLRISGAANGTYLIHSHGRGWIVEISAANIRLVQSLTFSWSAAHSIDELSKEAVDGPLHNEAFDGPLHPVGSTVFRASFSPEGTRIVTEGSDSARVWTNVGEFEFELDTGGSGTASAAFLIGRCIIVGTLDGAGYLWNEQGQRLLTLKQGGKGLDFFVLAVDPSRRYFASTINQSGVVEIWDADGNLVSTLTGHEGHVWSADFSPDGRYIATGGQDRTVRAWDWHHDRCIFKLNGHGGTVHDVQFDPKNRARLLSACHEGEVRLWTLDPALLPQLKSHTTGATRLVNTADGVFSSAPDRTVLWDVQALKARQLEGSLLDWTAGPGSAVTVLTAATKVVRLCRIEGPSQTVCLCEAEGWLRPALSETEGVLSPDGTRFLLLCASGYELRSDSAESLAILAGQDLPRVEQEQGTKRWAGFRSDGAAIVTADMNGMVWLWTGTGNPMGRFLVDHASPDRLLDLTLDPRGEYIATGIRNEAQLWAWGGKCVRKLPSSGYKVGTVRFTPNGFRIVTIADNPSGTLPYVELWERDGRKVPIPYLPEPGFALHFDPHSRYFCVQSVGQLAIIGVSGDVLGTLAAARGTYLRDVAISLNGNRVAAIFSDNKVRFWDLESGSRAGTLEVGPANRILFTPDSRFLLAAMPEGPIEQHALDIEYLFPLAAIRIDRALTPAEMSRFAVPSPLRLDLDHYRAGGTPRHS